MQPLQPDKIKLCFEWVYGEQPSPQTINFSSVGRNNILAITEAEEQNYGDLLDFGIDNLKLTVTPANNQTTWYVEPSEDLIISVNRVSTAEGETDDISVPEIHFTCNILKTPEKYNLTVEGGLATSYTISGNFLNWELVEDASSMMQLIENRDYVYFSPNNYGQVFVKMSPNNVIARANYKKYAPYVTFSETAVSAHPLFIIRAPARYAQE